MKLYLDDNLASRSLASLLRKSGHAVTIPADVGTSGHTDAQHLAFTATSSLTCMTGDHGDFLDLHLLVRATGGRHCGILTVRRDNDPTRDMKWQNGATQPSSHGSRSESDLPRDRR